MRKLLAVLMLLVFPCALPSQSSPETRPPRIICTPPPPGKIQKMVRPAYPADAKKKGIFGKVLVEMIIDKRGRPKSLRVTEGDPILAQETLRALSQWRWKPYKLNGEAVEVETTVTVKFEPR